MKNNSTDMKSFSNIYRTVIEPLSNRYRTIIEPISRHKHLLALLFVLVLGVGSAFASNVNGGHVYFDASTSGWGSSAVNYVIGHNSYSCWYDMASISNTKLHYVSSNSWGDATYFAFTTAYGWGDSNCEGNSYDSRKGYGPSGKKATTKNTSFTLNSGSVYLFYTANSNDGAAITTSSPAGTISSGVTGLNYTQTIKYALSTNGGSTYSEVTSGKVPATITSSSYKFVAGTYNSVSTSSQSPALTSGGTKYSATIAAARTATTTLTVSSYTGYDFVGWYTAASGGTQLSTSTSYTYYPTAATTIYARFKAKTSIVTLSYSGESNYSSAPSGVKTSVTATYGLAMPAMGTAPVGTAYHGFAGYYTGHNGSGTKYYNADGSSARNWDKTTATTLYAYFKPVEIENLVCSPASVGIEETDSVTVTPTLSPMSSGTVNICWEVQFSDGTPLDPQPEGRKLSGHVYKFKSPSASGPYKVEATLHQGSDCSGTVLDTKTANFTAAANHTVKVHYECGGDVIKPLEEVAIEAAGSASVTAPTIVGYAFHHWVLGDGVSCESGTVGSAGSAGTATISISAIYDGNLTAVYTKKRVIYFNNTNTNWSSVHVYFYKNNSYWGTSGQGTGANTTYTFTNTPYSEGKHGAMTRIDGTNVWYFDAEAAGVNASYTTVAFSEKAQHNTGYFNNNNKVARRDDYYSGTLPMFVPIAQTGTSMNGGTATYYNDGYWMNYPENTGYTLHVYDRISEDGAIEVRTAPFDFTEDKTLSMPIDVELEAAHTYGFKVERADGNWYGNNGTMNSNNSGDVDKSQDIWAITMGTNKCGLLTTAAGTYTFRFSYGYSSGANYLMGVKYPASVSDFQILYNDNAKWSQSSAHASSWIHPSRVIEARAGGVDTISFFVAKSNSPLLKARKVSSINAGTGAITWASLNIAGASSKSLTVSKTGIYNFKITQGAKGVISSVENIGEYTGNYYIRTDAANGKWDTYKTDEEHLMTYSSYAEAHSPANYTHFYVKFVSVNTNIKYVIANDYSPCISDTIAQVTGEPVTVNSGGTMTAPASGVNIRYMWDIRTNKLSRAYLTGPISNDYFYLRSLRSQNKTYRDAELNRLGHVTKTESSTSYDVDTLLFTDIQNWIYRADIYAKPGATYKLVATVNGKTTFFRGKEGNYTTAANIDTLIGGTGSSAYHMRLLYDFRHDRMVKAWMPSGNITENLAINTDVMILRDHQEAAQQITFSNAKLSNVHTVYGVMQFNRWILNNRANPNDQATAHCNTTAAISTYHPVLDEGSQKSIYERALYFISFPFDVKLNEVFGFGKYGTHWILSTYNGKRRAERGYFYDNCINEDCTNWDYIIPEWGYDPRTFVLQKNTGYLLSLDLDLMQYDDTTHFWTNQIHEVGLYFPSEVEEDSIQATTAMHSSLGSEYLCTINHNIPEGTNPEGDRRIKDSYWRCIGVPSYANYTNTLSNGSSTIQWQSGASMPYIYEWNVTDNSLRAQSTSNFPFKAMHAYLIQNQSEIHWTAVNAKPSSIVARKKTEPNSYEWRLVLLRNGKDDDQAYIRMTDNDDVTENFDFNQDLSKEFNYGHSDIYTLIGYERAAANSMPINSETVTIPVGLSIEYNGEYTFSLPDGTNGVGITLIDKEANTRTNLALGNYTVALGQGQFDNRFELEISPVQNAPTGIENTEVSGQDSSIRKVLIDGVLYIVRDDKIYDSRGVRIQ